MRPLQLSIVTLGSEGAVLVMASDGVWGTFSDEEAISIATSQENAQNAAEAILAEANRKGIRDNVSVIVVMWTAETAAESS